MNLSLTTLNLTLCPCERISTWAPPCFWPICIRSINSKIPLLKLEKEVMSEAAFDDPEEICRSRSQSTNQSVEWARYCMKLLCDLQIFSGSIYHPATQPHAQSLFLFPIVFGIYFSSFSMGRRRRCSPVHSIICFGFSITFLYLFKAGPPWFEFMVIFDFFAPWHRKSREASFCENFIKKFKEKAGQMCHRSCSLA